MFDSMRVFTLVLTTFFRQKRWSHPDSYREQTAQGAFPCANLSGQLAGLRPPLRCGLRCPPRAAGPSLRDARRVTGILGIFKPPAIAVLPARPQGMKADKCRNPARNFKEAPRNRGDHRRNSTDCKCSDFRT